MLENIFVSVVITSLIGTVLMVVLMLLKPITRKVFPASWNYYIWVCVLAVMILPFRVTLPESDIETAPQTMIDVQAPRGEYQEVMLSPFDADLSVEAGKPAADTDTDMLPVDDTSKATYTMKQILSFASVIWIFMASILFAYKLVRYFVFMAHTYKTSYPIDIAQLKSKRVSARVSGITTSPLMTGVFKPLLLLPDIVLSEEQLNNIIIHEMTHYKRHDMLVKWFSVAVKCLHFFNPAVYFICRQLDEECEFSCDASVVKDMTRESELSYVNTIIVLLSENNSKCFPMTTGMAGSKEALKKRFLLIKNKKRISKKAVLVSVITAILLIVAAFILGGILNGRIIKNEREKANTKTNLSEIAVDMPLDLETASGVGVEIAFESEDTLIFYGDFGLFGYDLRSNEITFSVDFVKAVGIEGSVQGSYGTAVEVSNDGNTVIISEYNVETEKRGKTCYIDIPSLTYEHGEYEPIEKPFNNKNIKGSVYPGVKIGQIKYMIDGKELNLFGTSSINTDYNLTDSNHSSFRTRYIFEFYGMLDFVAELVDPTVLSNWLEQFDNGKRSLWDLTLFAAVSELGIPKESLLEANTQNGGLFTDEQIASLYSNDIKKVNECFVNPYALLHDGKIYTADWLATHTASEYKNVGITADEIKEYLNKINIYELNSAYIPIAINANSMDGFDVKITSFDVRIGTNIISADGINVKAKCKDYGTEYTVKLNFEPDHMPITDEFYWIKGTYDFTKNILIVQAPEDFHCPQRYMHTD
ncbi:MAG: M56 family metallopeptidase [Ruminococcaceae bacterium]|nr:M56 family metallopeptidase [Oscillospiraceae bacterium]